MEKKIPSKAASQGWSNALIVAAVWIFAASSYAEVCTTQSLMKPQDRDSIASTARAFASKVQSNDTAGLRQQSVPEFAKDYGAMNSTVANTAAKITGDALAVEQVYLLDATNLKPSGDGSNQDAQFFCSLNNSMAEATFLIPGIPPGRYAFAQVIAQGPKTSWGLSFLLRQDAGNAWNLAGFYPKSRTGAGHDGLWYWSQARAEARSKQLWTSYLLYQEAQNLLQPAGFVGSTHLEKLQKEMTSAAPPALSQGVSPEAPLVIKGPDGAEFHVTSLAPDDSVSSEKLYVVIHLAPDPEPDVAGGTKPASKPAAPPSPKDRNASAMTALLAAYPELRTNFGGVWVFAETAGRAPFVTEQAMTEIR